MAAWPYNTRQWQRLRGAKLDADPLCEVCLRRDQLVSASHVDHITAINAGGDPFPPLEELMSMCASCHSVKTCAIDRPGGSGIAFKGCDANGRPIDPDHPFYR